MPRRSPRLTAFRVPTPVLWAGLLVLALIAGGLSAAAVLQGRAAQQLGVAAAEAAATQSERPETPGANDPGSDEIDLAPAPATPQRVMVAGATPGHLIRATTGTCPAPAGIIEVSFDDGETWESGRAPDDSASQVLQFDASDPELSHMVSLVADSCQPRAFQSFVGGTTWEPADGTDGRWYLDPSASQTAHTPLGPVALPCSAVELSASNTRAIVLCDDTTLTISSDSGATWSTPLSVPHAVAVGLAPSQFIYATSGSSDCPDIQLGVVSESGLGPVSTCLDATAAPGQIAIAATNDLVVVWAGDTLSRSFDDGVTWE